MHLCLARTGGRAHNAPCADQATTLRLPRDRRSEGGEHDGAEDHGRRVRRYVIIASAMLIAGAMLLIPVAHRLLGNVFDMGIELIPHALQQLRHLRFPRLREIYKHGNHVQGRP